MENPAPPQVSLFSPNRIGLALFIAFWGVFGFMSAGTIGWRRGWTELALLYTLFLVNYFILKRLNPAVLAGRQKHTRPKLLFDRIISNVFMLAILAIAIVAGQDAANGRHAPLSAWWLVPGFTLHIAGNAVMLWAMAVNPFLEQTVRIQSERGHRVVSSGPYRFVRHPMYLGCILLFLGIPLVLGSGRALAPAALVALALTLRTAFEDRLLIRELPGYADFARRTPHRLLPGIW